MLESPSQHTIPSSLEIRSDINCFFLHIAHHEDSGSLPRHSGFLVSSFSLYNSSFIVELEFIGKTAVKALLKNNGPEDVKLFKTGTFPDDSHVEKVEVSKAEGKVPFAGIRPPCQH